MIELSNEEMGAIAVSVIALAAFAWAMHKSRTKRYLGTGADFWEPVRKLLVPANKIVKEKLGSGHYTSYTLSPEEHVGVIDKSPEVVEQILYRNGYKRMPLAAYKKLPSGRGEVGSWAYRDGLMAEYQTHIMLFRLRDGRTSVYAHREYNALNPLRALQHYKGKYYSAEDGEQKVRESLPDDIWDE